MESNLDLTENYWDSRYIDKTTGWDIGFPSTPIVDYFNQLGDLNLKILIPGCGNAYEAEFLWHKGFKNVYVLDFSQKALELFKNRVPNFPQNQLILSDFFEHHNKYDIIIEQTFFCALNPTLRKKYVIHSYDLLNSNGKIVGLLFNEKLNNDKPPFGGTKEEYDFLFNPSFNINIMKKAYNSIEPRKDRELFIKLTKKQ